MALSVYLYRESSYAGRDGRENTEGYGDDHEGLGAVLREPRARSSPQRHQSGVQSHQVGELRGVPDTGQT